jgi:hypothetical protein
MTERLTLKKLSDELVQLRAQMQEMEMRLEQTFASRLESALAAAAPAKNPGTTSASLTGIDAAQRMRMITHEAYLIAERRNFQGGDPSQDWIEAEKLVDYRLMQPGEPPQPVSDASKARKKTVRSSKKPGNIKKADTKSSDSAKS